MVRLATADDVLSIGLVARLTLDDTYQEMLHENVRDQFIEDFYNSNVIGQLVAEHKVLLVENEDRLTVGFVSLQISEGVCEIVSNYILPNYQNQGYGLQLIETIKKNSEITQMYIDIESRNLGTQKFYVTQGFEKETSYAQDLYGQLLKMTRFRWIR